MEQADQLVSTLTPLIFKVLSEPGDPEVLKACSVGVKLSVAPSETERAMRAELCHVSRGTRDGEWVKQQPALTAWRRSQQSGLERVELFVTRNLGSNPNTPPSAPKELLRLCAERGSSCFRDIVLTQGLTVSDVCRPHHSLPSTQSWFQPFLLASYNVTGADLLQVPDMNLQHLQSLRPDARELSALRLDAKTLATVYGMRVHDLSRFGGVGADEWVQVLALTKEVLEAHMGMTVRNIAQMLNAPHLAWSEIHLEGMGFTAPDFVKYRLSFQ